MKTILTIVAVVVIAVSPLSAQVIVDWGSDSPPPNGSGLPWDPSGGSSPATSQGVFTADSLQVIGGFNNQFGWQNFGLNYDTSGITDTSQFLQFTASVAAAPSLNTEMIFEFNDVTNGNVKVQYNFILANWNSGQTVWLSTTTVANPVSGTFDGNATWDFVQWRDNNLGGTPTGSPWNITVDNITAVPEPGNYTLLAGLMGIILVFMRRRC